MEKAKHLFKPLNFCAHLQVIFLSANYVNVKSVKKRVMQNEQSKKISVKRSANAYLRLGL